MTTEQDPLLGRAQPPERRTVWEMLRLTTMFVGFTVLGMSVSVIGPLVTPLEKYYSLSDTMLSMVILLPTIGNLAAAGATTWLHYEVGRGGVSMAGVLCLFINAAICMVKPPYWVFLVGQVIGGLGGKLMDSTWNAWIGSMADSNKILGILHGCFGIGGIVGPSLVTVVLSAGQDWNWVYVYMAAFQVAYLAVVCVLFWSDDAAQYRRLVQSQDQNGENSGEIETSENSGETGAATHTPPDTATDTATQTQISVLDAFLVPEVWKMSLVLVVYNGAENICNSWLVTYMVRTLGRTSAEVGYVSSFFWLGLSAGRMFLGFVTDMVGTLQLPLTVYLSTAAVSTIVFWYTTHAFWTACAAIFTTGFFVGPLFPSTLILATRVLPNRLHVPAICAATVVSSIGSAPFPVVVGGLMDAFEDPNMVPGSILVCIVTTLVLWVTTLDERKVL